MLAQAKIVANCLVQGGSLGNEGVREGIGRGDRGLEEEVLGSVSDGHKGQEQEELDGVVGGVEGADLVKVYNHVDGQPGVEARVDNQTVHSSSEECHVDLDAAVDGEFADGLRTRCRLAGVVEVERAQEVEGGGEGEHVDDEAHAQGANGRLVEDVEQRVVGDISEDGKAEKVEVWEGK